MEMIDVVFQINDTASDVTCVTEREAIDVICSTEMSTSDVELWPGT